MHQNKVNGQIRVHNDKAFKYQSDNLLLSAGIKHPNFKLVNFELRYWIDDYSRKYAHELYIIDRLKDGTWMLSNYTLCYDDAKSSYKIVNHKDSLLTNWNSQWNILQSYNILDLPDEAMIANKLKTSNGATIVVADGTGYLFELITEKAKRSFNYSNPDTNLKIYGNKIVELLNVNQIISILNAQFKVDLSKRCKCN